MKKTNKKKQFKTLVKLAMVSLVIFASCQSNLNDEIPEQDTDSKLYEEQEVSEKSATGANRDIKLKFYLGDRGQGNDIGNVETPGWVADKQNQWSEWGGDADNYDPDWIVLELLTRTTKNLKNLDFRIAIQLSDDGGFGNGAGTVRYTPWASQGGGWSIWATDADAYDFDGVRFKIETRPYSGFTVEDVRFGVQLTDHGTSNSHRGIAKYTPWLSQGGGSTGYAGDRDFYDPDAIRIKLEVIR